MKALTKNLMLFAVFFFMGDIVFRYSLSDFIESRSFNLIWLIAVIYFFFNFFIGWFFGKRDYESIPLNDIGFRFHFITYFLFNVVSVLWFSFGFNSHFESIRIVYITALFWGIGLLIHFIFYLIERKNSINGLNKEDIFE
ncbi:MAG: 2TM domain-containing protein [Candidatus Marinimicrobia bacterium]|nr:2TM domain-containing protein [Candidatus Neomarinimicrobiota bacterium]